MPPPKKPAVLTINALHFSYSDQLLLTNFNADIYPGITLVCGGDGCGKSTLLRLMAGVLLPASGDLFINSISVRTQPVAYQQQVIWLDPRSNQFDQITALEFFESQRKRAHVDDAALSLLKNGLDLAQHQHKPLFQLSTGTKRKVWLAAALASGATVTLLDEPFAALDAPSIRFTKAWLKSALAECPDRVWILGDHTVPTELPLASVIDLGE